MLQGIILLLVGKSSVIVECFISVLKNLNLLLIELLNNLNIIKNMLPVKNKFQCLSLNKKIFKVFLLTKNN